MKAMSKALGSQLSATLMKAMQEQGPVHGSKYAMNKHQPSLQPLMLRIKVMQRR